ncbi:MAG: hypothetical protein GF307_11745 [candidate division Zixibacteria bacterium]|nr:hypothetical protein [candidate division Zixibacteria bacterium]
MASLVFLRWVACLVFLDLSRKNKHVNYRTSYTPLVPGRSGDLPGTIEHFGFLTIYLQTSTNKGI